MQTAGRGCIPRRRYSMALFYFAVMLREVFAGYPEDHLTQLMGDLGCQQVKYAGDGLLTHRCDSLPGDSGAPLLLQTQSGWHVVGVQSSAPDAENRWQADNLAVAIPFWKKQLQAWLR